MDEAWRVQFPKNLDGFTRPLRTVRGDAGIQRPARTHSMVERTHRLFDRGIRVEAVRVENVDVLEPHPLE